MTETTAQDTYNPAAGDRRCAACVRIPWDPRVWDLLARYNRRRIPSSGDGPIGPFHHRSECELAPKYRAMAVDAPFAREVHDNFHQHSECHDDIEFARKCIQDDCTLGNGDPGAFWKSSLSERHFESDYAQGLGGLREAEAEYLRSVLDAMDSSDDDTVHSNPDQHSPRSPEQASAWGSLVKYFEESLTTGADGDARAASVFQSSFSPSGKMTLYFNHHRNMDALRKAATEGCYLCRTFRTLLYSRWQMFAFPEEVASEIKIVLSDDSDDPGLVVLGFGYHGEVHVPLRKVSSWVGQRTDVSRRQTFKHTVDHDLQRLVEGVIDPWIQDCDAGDGPHEHCRPHQVAEGPVVLPTRLIDVGKTIDSPVRLVAIDDNVPDDAAEDPRYTILSYCWGNSNEPAKTTRANLHERQDEIDTRSLPRTIQDAIKLTRAMGIRYLWVDALCIIQAHAEDSYLEDFFREAPKMGSYYSKAYCLISALAAEDSAQGLFYDGEVGRFDIKPRAIGYNELHDTAWVVQNTAERIEAGSRMYTPTMERGWCLQERLLSPRVLHWTTSGVFWKCYGTEASELRPDPKALNAPDNASSLAQEYDGIVIEPLKERALGEFWTSLVKTYQLMSLGHEVDRLNAIQGLGNRLAEMHGDEYFAGLFLSRAAQGLLWQGEKRSGTHGSEDFPTWSWGASSHAMFTDPDVSLIREISIPSKHSPTPAAIEYTGFRGGREMRRLRLKAPLIDMMDLELRGWGLNRTSKWKYRDLELEFSFDEEGLIPEDSSFVQILLLGYMKELNPIVGIAVRNNEADRRYLERIGHVVVRTGKTEGSMRGFLERYMSTVDLI